jgi:hypothetical protein
MREISRSHVTGVVMMSCGDAVGCANVKKIARRLEQIKAERIREVGRE